MKKFTAILFLGGILAAASSGAVEKLYFSDVGADKIMRCELGGSGLEDLVTVGLEAAGGIAIDRGPGKMYWTDWSSGTSNIRRADLDGSNIEVLLTGLSGPYGIDLDVPAGKMYWTEFSIKKVRRANLDGTSVEDLVTTGLSHPTGIALDLAGGKMYWADGATEFSAKIMRANLDGSNVETLVTDPLIAPSDIALDPPGDWMYWSDLGTNSWFRAHLDGSGLEEILLASYETPIGIAWDPAAGKIYFSEFGGSSSEIKRANPDGTGVEILVSSGIGAIYGLTLGPDAAECDESWLVGPWLALVTGVEPYDYAVYLTFDGVGTIVEMGAFNVPDPAGTFAVGPDCSLTGELWSDGYVPFTGDLLSETTAEMDIGLGPMQLLKVSDPGALAHCWSGWFVHEPTGLGWNVTLEIDGAGTIISSTGFPASVTGQIFTEAGHLAGLLVFGSQGDPADDIMFHDASAEGDSLLWGTFASDCGDCPGGSFELHLCSSSAVGNGPSARSAVRLLTYPNPFNPWTTISFRLPEQVAVTLAVYDASGRLVRTLVDDQVFAEGLSDVVWNGRNDHGVSVASGVYFTRLVAGRYGETRRMTLVK